uniref:p14 n=1 Tax=Little cherry virus 2 TaxID=154339 RepID=A0A679G5G1_9CLOS|nr:p14 [Little cherry virus 2]
MNPVLVQKICIFFPFCTDSFINLFNLSIYSFFNL